jgi:hypothetical protein
MPTFKRVSLPSNLGPYAFYSLVGLPEGVSCNVCPEDGANPRGAWFVSAKRTGKKRVIRCKSLEEAKAAAIKWSESRPTKKPAAKK